MRVGSIAALAALNGVTQASPTIGARATAGNVTLSAFQLYPENGDYDPDLKQAFISVLYNASVAVYNPATNTFDDERITFPQTGIREFHASGIEVDAQDKKLSVLVNSGAAFDSQGANVTGDNFLYKVDLRCPSRTVLWGSNLTAVTDGEYGGCQDAAHDGKGNTFVVCTYPGALIKVNADGTEAVAWYKSNYTKPGDSPVQSGLTGIAPVGETLLATDDREKKLFRFDMSAATGVPIEVPVSGRNVSTWDGLDGILLPKKYQNKVLLVSGNSIGTNVLVSTDGWKSSKQVGFIAKTADDKAFSVATLEMEDRIYSMNEYFLDAIEVPNVNGTNAGPRKEFPLQDITNTVEAMVAKSGALVDKSAVQQ